MGALIARRLVEGTVSALLAFVLVFSFIRMIPGDPVDLMLGEQAQPAAREALRQNLGLDRPFLVQLAGDFAGLVRGDLGQSMAYRRPVAGLIADRAGPTAILAAAAILIAIAIALPLGLASGWQPGSRIDSISRIIAVSGISLPNFWLGPLLLLVFAVWLRWLPIGGFRSPSSVILPAITLGTALAAMLTRMLRSGVSETRQAMFITAARARGVPERNLLLKHALRPALIPVITILGLQIGAVLSGAVITETIFQWPGVGRLLIEAVQGRDYPVVQGVVLIMTGVYVGVNTLVDCAYMVVDPRIDTAAAN